MVLVLWKSFAVRVIVFEQRVIFFTLNRFYSFTERKERNNEKRVYYSIASKISIICWQYLRRPDHKGVVTSALLERVMSHRRRLPLPPPPPSSKRWMCTPAVNDRDKSCAAGEFAKFLSALIKRPGRGRVIVVHTKWGAGRRRRSLELKALPRPLFLPPPSSHGTTIRPRIANVYTTRNRCLITFDPVPVQRLLFR